MNFRRVATCASVTLLASVIPTMALVGSASAAPGNGAEHVRITYHDDELDYVLDGLQNMTDARDPGGHQLVMVHGTYSATLRISPGCELTEARSFKAFSSVTGGDGIYDVRHLDFTETSVFNGCGNDTTCTFYNHLQIGGGDIKQETVDYTCTSTGAVAAAI